ncbi:unnamed protein product [Ixodes pacificus]
MHAILEARPTHQLHLRWLEKQRNPPRRDVAPSAPRLPASDAKTIESSSRPQPAMCVFHASGERKADDLVGPFFRLRSVDVTLCACAADVIPRLPADLLLR